MITWGAYYWPWYLIEASALFLAGELTAIIQRYLAGWSTYHFDNTLTNYTHNQLNVSAQMTVHTLAWYLSLTGWITFFFVITAHIWFNWGG